MAERKYKELIEQLKAAGLRPTRQRLALGHLLFGENGDTERHVTAEQLHAEAMNKGVRVSLATVYNTLHQFTEAKLLREVVVEAGRSYFDTNVDDHHHFYFEQSGRPQDIPSEALELKSVPTPPRGSRIRRVDVILRVDEGD